MSENNLSSFEKWLGNVELPDNKRQFLEQNKELFDIVFEAGYESSKEDKIFKNIAYFHDVVVDTTEEDLSETDLKRLYYCLPDFWQEEIEMYGFYSLKDDLYTYFEKNGLPTEFIK